MMAPDALTALRALGQEHRLAAFRVLIEAGLDGLAVGELRERLTSPPPRSPRTSTHCKAPSLHRQHIVRESGGDAGASADADFRRHAPGFIAAQFTGAALALLATHALLLVQSSERR